MNAKEILKGMPLISISRMETSLGIPRGTIRLNNGRKIPEKYQQLIIESLSNYSPIHTHVVVEEKEEMPLIMDKIEFIPVGKQYVVKRISKLGIGEHAYFFGKMENGIFKRDNDIPDGSIVKI